MTVVVSGKTAVHIVWMLLLQLLCLAQVSAFGSYQAFWTRPAHLQQQTTTTLHMCICINCSRVTNCQAYHFVESKHQQPHISENPVS